MVKIKCKRVYEAYAEEDGVRILIDRLWPRGISKEKIKIDYWLKEVAPSHVLRKWYHHDLNKFQEFKERYEQELKEGIQKETLEKLKQIVQESDSTVTLLYAAKDTQHNQAVILKEMLEKKLHLD